jgi:hypothetical protein
LAAIPQVSSALHGKEYKDVINKMLSLLGDPNTSAFASETKKVTEKLTESSAEQPSVGFTMDNIAIVTLTQHDKFVDVSKTMTFLSMFREAGKATSIVSKDKYSKEAYLQDI